MADRIQLRRDTAVNWTQYNPILLEGEPGIELDTDQWKLGDGIHTWSQLAYRGGECVQQKGQSTTVAMSQKAVTDELNTLDSKVAALAYGDTVYNGTTAVTAGSSKVFFNDDVNIPRGSIIKFEIVEGWGTIINNFRYNINNTGNINAFAKEVSYKATENITHITCSVNSSSAIGTGNVTCKIYVLSRIDKNTLNIEENKVKINTINEIILGEGIYSGTIAVTAGSSASYFDGDVTIPKGSIIKIKVTEGFGDKITGFRYSLNNGSNVQISKAAVIIPTEEDITNLMVGSSSSTVAASGNVSIEISAYPFSKELSDLDEESDSLGRRLSIVEPKVSNLQNAVFGAELYKGNTAVTAESSASYFNDDVNIPKGSILKIEVTNGFGSKISNFRYNINNSDNVVVNESSVTLIVKEDITHLIVGTGSASVIADGNVTVVISACSDCPINIALEKTKEEVDELKTKTASLESKVPALENAVFGKEIADETIAVTAGSSASYFDGDVTIPKGSTLKIEITEGFGDKITTFRYNLNNTGNIGVGTNSVTITAEENITYLKVGSSSSSVISSGNVGYRISIVSKIEDIDREVSDIQLDTDGYTIGEPVVACTQGVRPTFFDDDVDIPAGKVLKFQVLSGYQDIITNFSYSINDGDAQYANSDIAFYEATEKVTHLNLSTAKANVISSGNVQVGIYVMSEFDAIDKELSEDAATLENHGTRITALESKVGGNSYDTDIETIAGNVFSEISEASGTNEEKVVFLHVTDTHSSDGEQYHMDFDRAVLHMNMVSQVAKAVNANFIIHTGDAIHGIDSTSVPESYRALIKGYNANIPLIFCEGNYAHDFGNNNEKLVRGQVQSYFGRNKMWIEDKTVYNTNDDVKSYFYFDDDRTKIRYIILDAQDDNGDHSERRDIGFSTEQITFVTSVLSDALTNGYSVFFFSHMPPTANLYPIEEGVDNSWGIETGGHGDVLIAAIKDFIDGGGVMLGFIYGHIHQDNMYFDSVTGIQYIGLVSDAPTKKPYYPVTWGTLVAWDRNLNDVTQFAFDVYVVSPASKKIKIFRFGAGIDRQYTLL